MDIDGLSPGVYEYTIVIYDRSGNTATDTGLVTVTIHIAPSSEPPSNEPSGDTSDKSTTDTGGTSTASGFTILWVKIGIACIFLRGQWFKRKK